MKRIVLLVFMAVIASLTSYGQGCSVCTSVAQGLGDKSARGLNGGIIYLALLPLAILGILGGIWWRVYRKSEITGS